MKLEFWFEFGSTYSYPTAMRIEDIADEKGLDLEWRPFLLGPIFNSQGWNDSPFNIYEAKGVYMWRDLERTCQVRKLGFKKPSVFPRNGLRAARVACRFSEQPWIPQFVRNVYCSNFVQDLDISDRNILLRCMPISKEEALTILDEAESQTSKDLLRENTERAISLGIFGAPSFVVGDELFWGDDRLDSAIDWTLKEPISQ